jgi:hypothetical protein
MQSKSGKERVMKLQTRIIVASTAIAIALALSSASGFAAKTHKAAAKPAARPLYNVVVPAGEPTYGPGSQNFNNTSWPGGQPARY